MKTLKGVLVNTKDNTIKPYSLEYDEFLPAIYGLLDCETIDIVARDFGSHRLDIICDDEGLFKEKVIPSVITFSEGNVVENIVGNVFICASDDEGELVSLTHAQEQEVLNSQAIYVNKDNELRKCLIAHI